MLVISKVQNVPSDLDDDIATRDYLHRQQGQFREDQIQYIRRATNELYKIVPISSPLSQIYRIPLLTDEELSGYVKALVKEFDDSLQATIKEVDNALQGNYEQVYLLTSELNENYATVEVIAGTYATQDEVGAIYGVTVEANGHVSGYKSIATGDSSIFQIYAEKFAISSSSTEEGYSPFQIDTVAHKINMTADVAIDGNLLVSDTITGDKIRANEITAAKIAANTITATEMAAHVITANEILANTITSIEMSTNVLLIGGKVESSTYSWNGGAPIGFGLYSAGDTVSGQAYNIIGGKIYGATIDAGDLRAGKMRTDALKLYRSTYPDNTAPLSLHKAASISPSGNINSNISHTFVNAAYGSGYRTDRYVADNAFFNINMVCTTDGDWGTSDPNSYLTCTLSGPGLIGATTFILKFQDSIGSIQAQAIIPQSTSTATWTANITSYIGVSYANINFSLVVTGFNT